MWYACTRTSKDWNFLPSFSIETKSWQKHQSLSDSNNLADLNNVNKEFLPRKSSKKFLQKKLNKNPPKKILRINSQKIPQKNPTKIPKKSQKNPNNFSKVPNFENNQFLTSHLEAQNPFGLVDTLYVFSFTTYLVTPLDLVTVFWQTKCVTKSGVHCTQLVDDMQDFDVCDSGQ